MNNSATNVGQGASLDVTDEMLDKMIEINIKAALRLVRLTVPRMIELGRGGSIINVSSISGLRPQPMGMLYSFTKAGLIMMTRSWAREFGVHGIRVNALAPGLIQTDFSAYFWEDEARRQQLVSDAADRAAGPAGGCRGFGGFPRFRPSFVRNRSGFRGGRGSNGLIASQIDLAWFGGKGNNRARSIMKKTKKQKLRQKEAKRRQADDRRYEVIERLLDLFGLKSIFTPLDWLPRSSILFVIAPGSTWISPSARRTIRKSRK